jgi:hypothetical protein
MSDDNHAIENGKGWMASIVELIDELAAARDAAAQDAPGADEKADEIRQRIEEGPLSVTVRGSWHTPGDPEGNNPVEYEILLSTGGPALRIYGELDEFKQPESFHLQWQDWFKPWTECDITDEEREALGEYAACFYFGE